MKIKTIIIICLSSFLLSAAGCATYPSKPMMQGTYFTNVNAPVNATDKETYSKKGKSTAKSILGLFAWGDASIKSAMDDADCDVIHHVDYNFLNIVIPLPKVNIPIYTEFTTFVYGE